MSERRHDPVFPGFKEMAQQRKSLAAALSARRVELGLSQTEVAARMGTSQSAVARLESGQADLRLSTLERYAAALGQRLDWNLSLISVEAERGHMSTGGPWDEHPSLDAQLLERRVVRIWGALDDASVARACAELMALDATGDEAVLLYVGSSGGPLHSAMSIIDTMDLLGVPVHVTCLGRAEGAAVGVVAAGRAAGGRPACPVPLDRAGGVRERERQPAGGVGRAAPGRAGPFR